MRQLCISQVAALVILRAAKLQVPAVAPCWLSSEETTLSIETFGIVQRDDVTRVPDLTVANWNTNMLDV